MFFHPSRRTFARPPHQQRKESSWPSSVLLQLSLASFSDSSSVQISSRSPRSRPPTTRSSSFFFSRRPARSWDGSARHTSRSCPPPSSWNGSARHRRSLSTAGGSRRPPLSPLPPLLPLSPPA